MNIPLSRELERYVKQQVENGSYDSAADVVRDALRLLKAGGFAREAALQAALGGAAGSDIEGLVFLVMMEAAKSAQEDLKALMAEVKAINAAKSKLRCLIGKVRRDVGGNAKCGRSNRRLKFAPDGMGSERAYHHAQMPIPDPEVEGGVRLLQCDLHDGTITRVDQLEVIRDGLNDRLDSQSEMSEMMQLRLQMYMDRRAKALEMLSNITKKISTTSWSIVGNLK